MTWNELIELLRFGEKPEEFQRRREEIAEWIPSVRIMFDYNQNNSYHQYDLWMHSVYTVLGLDKSIDDDMLYLAALLHDIGKPCSRCKGKKDDDKDSHYYGHPEKSVQIVREEVLPGLVSKGVLLSDEDKARLLYYVKYHDERVSFTPEYLKCHLKLADEQSFRKLMLLEIADAKAHIIKPVVKQRIDACSLWVEFITEK